MEIRDFMKLELPFVLEAVTKLTIIQQQGQHASCVIQGIVKENEIEKCIDLGKNSNIKIYVRQGLEDELAFYGVLMSVSITQREQLEVILKACSYSVLLDIEKKSRSYQRKQMDYEGIWKEVIAGHDGDFLAREPVTEKVTAPMIQYEETDWQFLNRLASHCGKYIVPSATGNRPQIYLGIGKGQKQQPKLQMWQLEKQIEEFLRFRKNEEAMEQSCLTCTIKSGCRYQVGDIITCSCVDFVVVSITTELKRGELVYQYRLRQKTGFFMERKKNHRLKGAMIEGNILAVKENQVKLHLEIDKEQDEADAFWYPLERTDWYCMPEVHSRAALYIPECEETKAYVTAICRQDGMENEKAQKPEDVYMETQHGKEMKLSPQLLHFYASEGSVLLEMTNKKGIQVKSERGIVVKAGRILHIKSKAIMIKSREKITLGTDKTNIVMDNLIQIKG